MKKLACIFIAQLFLLACQPSSNEHADNQDQEANTEVTAPNDSINGPLNYYLLDPFAEEPFELGVITLEKVMELEGARKKTMPVDEMRASINADSVVTVQFGNDRLVFYTGDSDEILYYGRLEDNRLRFRNGIGIGIDKKEFAEKFEGLSSVNDLPAVIQIANPNNREVYNFIFYQDTLGMVIYDSHIQ